MIYNFPTITPNASTFGLSSMTQNATSELNGVIQTFALPGDKWKAQMTFTNKKGIEANQLRAFLSGLRGRAGRFYLTPPGYHGPYSGSMNISASWVSGGVITTSAPALTADSTLITADSTVITADATAYWLLPGDYFEVLGELKMVTASVPNPGAGTCEISFVPPLRQPLPSGTSIVTDHPKCVMMLSDDNQAQWQMQPGIIYALSVAAEEAIF